MKYHINSKINQLETEIIKFADYVYSHTALKPMSKSLFFVSRLLLIFKFSNIPSNSFSNFSNDEVVRLLLKEYNKVRKKFVLVDDDYNLGKVLRLVSGQSREIIKFIVKINKLVDNLDVLGLVFNSMLRGKFEAGEGFGTHLTPEEVVKPSIEMVISCVDPILLKQFCSNKKYYSGDISGGTGRFMYHLLKRIKKNREYMPDVVKRFYLFDQSKIHTEFCEINFLLEEEQSPQVFCVDDSLTSETVSKLKGKCLFLLTNPPFGIGKYLFSKTIAIKKKYLNKIGLIKNGDTTDPAWVFLIRNLDLLCEGGALGIVLPNGIAHSELLVDLLKLYETEENVKINVNGVFDLPTVTFALGGTVAKTCFLILGKNNIENKLVVSSINHIGFIKSGNKRVTDPCGNEFQEIVETFCNSSKHNKKLIGCKNWRNYKRLSPKLLMHQSSLVNLHSSEKLSSLVERVKESGKIDRQTGKHFHISILDVEDTGLIDLKSALTQSPTTKPLVCKPGDIILSCLNPNIWRTAYIPEIEGSTWTCSPEFVVLRPFGSSEMKAEKLFLRLQNNAVKKQVIALGRGTSSSRQRVQKSDVDNILIPKLRLQDSIVRNFVNARKVFYQNRLFELQFIERVANDMVTTFPELTV